MKKPIFNKDMTVQQIEEAAAKRWLELHAVHMYLNNRGRAVYDALSTIECNCPFAHDVNELIELLEQDIRESRYHYDETVTCIRNFEKMFK